jgi:hypothetical protein
MFDMIDKIFRITGLLVNPENPVNPVKPNLTATGS